MNSDCHDAVLENLIENMDLNLAGEDYEEMEKTLLFRKRLRVGKEVEFGVLNLPWEDVDKHKEELKSCKFDVILAADVVYDDSIFDALTKCIRELYNISGPNLVFLLSQTVRNPDTFTKFVNLLHADSFETADEQISSPITSDSSEIRLLRISKASCK
jgi:protein-lysine N-methyltransferase EEF2KMT